MSLLHNNKGDAVIQTTKRAGRRGCWLRRWGGAALAAALLAGCAYPPPLPVSRNHIQAEPQTKASGIPEPIKAGSFVPPPKPSARPQTYSVVVNEVPVKELLFALARDSKLNVDVHPAIQGLVTMNAVNEPIETILERLSAQVSLRYKIDGNTLSITPDTPYMQTYRVDYVNLSRQTESAIGITTQIASVGSSTATGGQVSGGGGAVGNSSTTSVKSKSDNSFWDTLGENVRNIISSTRAVSQNAERKSEARAMSKEERAIRQEEREERRKDAMAVMGRGPTEGATTVVSVAGAPSTGAAAASGLASLALLEKISGEDQLAREDVKKEVIVNPIAGTLTALATERQHKLIKQHLDSVMSSARRQVLIEATIVEVALGDQYRAGVDWTKLSSTGSVTQSLLGGRGLGPAPLPFFTLTYTNPDSKIGNIAATVSLLEQFGDTKVLSSPKIMALNNQTAVLKVVDNLVYFTISVVPAIINSSGGVTTPATYTSDPHTVPVGLVMSVTPQVNGDGMVSLTVRPTISRHVNDVEDPNPALALAKVSNKVPVIQVREMESVLQVKTGQTIIMGGLMQDDVSKKRDGLPLVSRIPGLGDAFSYRDDNAKKTELVIFLRPTVITNPSLDSDELRAYRHYLPADAPAPAAKP